jgi:hypothetical protein
LSIGKYKIFSVFSIHYKRVKKSTLFQTIGPGYTRSARSRRPGRKRAADLPGREVGGFHIVAEVAWIVADLRAG